MSPHRGPRRPSGLSSDSREPLGHTRRSLRTRRIGSQSRPGHEWDSHVEGRYRVFPTAPAPSVLRNLVPETKTMSDGLGTSTFSPKRHNTTNVIYTNSRRKMRTINSKVSATLHDTTDRSSQTADHLCGVYKISVPDTLFTSTLDNE